MSMPSWVNRLITSPRIVLPLLPAYSRKPSTARLLPSIATSGTPPKPTALLPLMNTASSMIGNATAPRLIVCTPPPMMLKLMTSAALLLAVLLAAVMASRSETTPSVPRLAASADSDAVSPSATSLAVSTVIWPNVMSSSALAACTSAAL